MPSASQTRALAGRWPRDNPYTSIRHAGSLGTNFRESCRADPCALGPVCSQRRFSAVGQEEIAELLAGTSCCELPQIALSYRPLRAVKLSLQTFWGLATPFGLPEGALFVFTQEKGESPSRVNLCKPSGSPGMSLHSYGKHDSLISSSSILSQSKPPATEFQSFCTALNRRHPEGLATAIG